jgi:hypothetical protein
MSQQVPLTLQTLLEQRLKMLLLLHTATNTVLQ